MKDRKEYQYEYDEVSLEEFKKHNDYSKDELKEMCKTISIINKRLSTATFRN